MIHIGHLDVCLESREIRLNGTLLRIGSRAFDIFELLIRAQGELVSKDEIMQRVWPDTVVEENNLQVHVASLRKALASDRELIRTVPGRGYRLISVRDEHAAAQVSRAIPSPVPQTLPVFPSAQALVGRQDCLDEIIGLLGPASVVTLVGAGGIGKTRIAIEAAQRVHGDFPDGVVFVSLGAVSDERFVIDALASALGMTLPAGRLTLADVVARLQGGRALIVLDNCEHVIGIAADIADAIMAAAPHIGVLATSREALRIPDELLYRVPPLDVPEEGSSQQEIVATSAVQLFLARARAVDPRFSLDERSVPVTGLVCRQLDGIPLAIELAAARAAVLGVDVLATHLDEHFRILTGGFRSAVPRHQTLKAMLDWSYRLLDDTERTLLRWLGVFLNGFSFDAAFQVMNTHGLAQAEILDALCGLVSKSLVIHENTDAPRRYRLLATTRAYALQQLDDNGERKAAALAHATWFQRVFAQLLHQRLEQTPDDWLDGFRHELGNLRTALDWAFSPGGERRVGIELAAAAVPALFDVSLVDECCERAKVAIAAMRDKESSPVCPETKLRLLSAYAAGLVYTHGPVQAVHDGWSEVLALAIATGSDEYESRALWGLWNAHQYGGSAAAALQLARRFGALAQRIDQPTLCVIGRRIEGIALHYAGEPGAAREKLERMLDDYAPARHPWNAVGFRIEHSIVARATLARVLWVQGHTRQALELAEETLEAALAYGHEMMTCYVLVEGLVPIALMSHAFEVARRGIAILRPHAAQSGFAIWVACCDCYDEYLKSATRVGAECLAPLRAAIDVMRDMAFLAPLTLLLAQLGRCLLARGRLDDAAAALAQALAHCEATGERWYYPELCRLNGEIARAAGRDADAQAAFDAALHEARRQGARQFERTAAASYDVFVQRRASGLPAAETPADTPAR